MREKSEVDRKRRSSAFSATIRDVALSPATLARARARSGRYISRVYIKYIYKRSVLPRGNDPVRSRRINPRERARRSERGSRGAYCATRIYKLKLGSWNMYDVYICVRACCIFRGGGTPPSHSHDRGERVPHDRRDGTSDENSPVPAVPRVCESLRARRARNEKTRLLLQDSM